MFVIAQHQNKIVVEMWSLRVDVQENVEWLQIPRLVDLYKLLESFQVLKDAMDCLWWTGHNKGTTKWPQDIRSWTWLGHGPQNSNWPWKQIWKAKIPHKVACFTWFASKAGCGDTWKVEKERNYNGYTLVWGCSWDSWTSIFTLQNHWPTMEDFYLS